MWMYYYIIIIIIMCMCVGLYWVDSESIVYTVIIVWTVVSDHICTDHCICYSWKPAVVNISVYCGFITCIIYFCFSKTCLTLILSFMEEYLNPAKSPNLVINIVIHNSKFIHTSIFCISIYEEDLPWQKLWSVKKNKAYPIIKE